MPNAYMEFGEYTVGPPLTPDRQSWLKYVLENYGVSATGAAQFVGAQSVTDQRDRQQILDILNRVVTQKDHRMGRGFRGKGAR
jgi:hypothetical protein